MIAIPPKDPTKTGADRALIGELVDHPNPAFKAVKLSDGLFLTVTPEGEIRHDPHADTVAGPWQAFAVGKTGCFLIARRGGTQDYMLPFETFDGPAIP